MREQACKWLHDYAQSQRALFGIMPVILVKLAFLFMACSGSGVPRWRR